MPYGRGSRHSLLRDLTVFHSDPCLSSVIFTVRYAEFEAKTAVSATSEPPCRRQYLMCTSTVHKVSSKWITLSGRNLKNNFRFINFSTNHRYARVFLSLCFLLNYNNSRLGSPLTVCGLTSSPPAATVFQTKQRHYGDQ